MGRPNEQQSIGDVERTHGLSSKSMKRVCKLLIPDSGIVLSDRLSELPYLLVHVQRAAMPRRARCVLPGVSYHVTQRGVDRQATFSRDEDRHTYLRLLRENLSEAEVRVWAW